jgi:predicted enzyme related to lactoylglutathione lyase
MTVIGSVVWGVRDIERAVAFWGAALDYELKRPADIDWAMLAPRQGEGIQLSLKLTNSDAPRRHHLDLFTDDQEGEVVRLLALGATRVDDWEYEHGADYVVLTDPDGNTFCLVQV